MISKHLTAHSFYHTCRYIITKPGAELLVAEGVREHDFKLMSKDFAMQQALRPEKKHACLHAILSFYPGENPGNDQMNAIAKEYLEQLNIVNTQYAISKHTDKAHLHLHIIANMVNNDGRPISDSWIGLRGKKIAQQLTKQYQLTPATEKHIDLTHLESLNAFEATKYKIYQVISEELPRCKSLQELEIQLLRRKISTEYKYKGKTLEKQGISFKMGEYSFKGSQVDRRFSFSNLQKAILLNQKTLVKQGSMSKNRYYQKHERTQQQERESQKENFFPGNDFLRHEKIDGTMNPELQNPSKKPRRRRRRLKR